MSIAQSILDLVLQEAARHGLAKITAVDLKIGQLSGVVPDSLSFCWEIVAAESPAEGSVLNMENIPLLALCNACGRDFEVQDFAFSCPACDSGDIKITQGQELSVSTIEAE